MNEKQLDLQGHRIPEPETWDDLKEGDYFKDKNGVWFVCCPNTGIGSPLPLKVEGHPERTWTVTEHEDGTISVTPSLMLVNHWHGYLTKGFFKSC